MTLRSLFYNFHIFSFSIGFISGFNNHLNNIHLTIPRKIPKLAQFYPEYITIFIIKILGYFWGVTLPIPVWSPSVQSTELPFGASEGKGRKHLGHERDEDSLLANAELAAGALSFILRDSNLKKADSMSVREALASLLQGAVMVYPDAFTCPSYR